MLDYYNTIENKSYGEYKEKGSKFLAYAFPMTTEEQLACYLEEVKSLHPKARHHCYAYRIGIDGDPYRANDDGEPSGTAGRPILGQLKSYEVSDLIVVVVRYFGGTLLGASGLIQAYKLATQQAIEAATIITRVLSDRFRLTFTYAEMGHVMNTVKQLQLHIVEKTFEEEPYIVVEIRASEIRETLIRLKAALLQVSTEQVDDDTKIDFCNIEKMD